MLPIRGRHVAIAAVAWDIPGLDQHALLAETSRTRPSAMLGEFEPSEADRRLRAVCLEVLERAGLGRPARQCAVDSVLAGDRSAGPEALRGSFSALAHALRTIERGDADRVIVAGLMRFDSAAIESTDARTRAHGVCAVLLETESSFASRPIGRSRLIVVAHAESAFGECGRAGILGLLRRHADKTLYVGIDSALLPAIDVIANLQHMHVVDLAANVPNDADCLCLLQLISFFERHSAGTMCDPGGAVFATDGARANDPAGVIVIAPAGEPPWPRLCD